MRKCIESRRKGGSGEERREWGVGRGGGVKVSNLANGPHSGKL